MYVYIYVTSQTARQNHDPDCIQSTSLLIRSRQVNLTLANLSQPTRPLSVLYMGQLAACKSDACVSGRSVNSTRLGRCKARRKTVRACMPAHRLAARPYYVPQGCPVVGRGLMWTWSGGVACRIPYRHTPSLSNPRLEIQTSTGSDGVGGLPKILVSCQQGGKHRVGSSMMCMIRGDTLRSARISEPEADSQCTSYEYRRRTYMRSQSKDSPRPGN